METVYTVRPPKDFEKVLIAQMALDGTPSHTIAFFLTVYPSLRSIGLPLSQIEMGELADMTPSAAKKHIDRLTQAGYLQREHYCGWKLPLRYPITEPLFITIARSLI